MVAHLIFDFDSTLVRDEGLDVLFEASLPEGAERAERTAAFRALTDQGMSGEISYEASLNARIRLLSAHRDRVLEVGEGLARRLSPSVERSAAFFQGRAEVHIVSGGFFDLIEPAARRLGIPSSRVHAHRFLFDASGMTRGFDPGTPMARGGKPEVLRELGVDPSRTWVIGDGATDLELRTLGLAATFVAFTENRTRPEVVGRADHVAQSMDDLLHLLSGRIAP